jgi:putative methyltransferase
MIAAWVKETFPKCIVVSGGPHQYLKHDDFWFKNNKHLDASHLGDSYGELFFKDLLDNYDNGKVDWAQVTDARYPIGQGRMIAQSSISLTRNARKSFDYDWSSFHSQLKEFKLFEQYQQIHFPKSNLLSVIETTRGCPYGCTYCDWGGGIGTTVIQKSIINTRDDIDAIVELNLTYLYIADANFGIFGQRDVDIIKYIAKRKKETRSTFKVGYGGFAKTENKLDYIRQILEVDIDNKLSNNKEIKISIQSLDKEVLKNIDRKNIDLNKQLLIFKPIAVKTKLPLYVEIIMGLPSMTLDKFYYELSEFGYYELSIQWFEWILLPEAPAYSYNYRQQWEIKTTTKTNGWSYPESHAQHEIVIETKTYTNLEYFEMLISASLYNLLVQGGFYKNTIQWIISNHRIKHGELIRKIFNDFFRQMPEYHYTLNEWSDILTNPVRDCTINQVYVGYYFVEQVFTNDNFSKELVTWINYTYSVPKTVQSLDNGLYITSNNSKIHITDLINRYRLFSDTGNIMQRKKRFFWK